MLDLTFLTEDQVRGDNKLDILKKYGIDSKITDLASLTGVDYQDYDEDVFGDWWTKSLDSIEDNKIKFISSFHPFDPFDLYVFNKDIDDYSCGIRPAFKYSSIKSICSDKVREVSGIKEIEYGEYPQRAVDDNFSLKLEELYNEDKLNETGKKYTMYFFENYLDVLPEDIKRIYIEYEYEGRKYIRFMSEENIIDEYLADGRLIQEKQPYWVKVEPITWLVDEKADIALSKYIILSGIPFDDKEYKGDFENTFIKRFMDEYLSKEIECGVYKEKLIENKQVDIDSIFEDVIKKMNEINEVEEVKTKVLK